MIEYASKQIRFIKELLRCKYYGNIDNKKFVLDYEQNEYENFPLEFCSKNLRDDLKVVKLAVYYEPFALALASDRLKNERNLILYALKNEDNRHYPIFMFADKRLKDDEELALKRCMQI
ncbi:hypothetical protein AVCANL279_06230 [Campylobacter canadensis]|uniref:hypothetical protein n=1 Tax=Campylobacter canadensis TaxID=449520 RepID=UPI001CCA722B|nr:hypothetical protein [Campylobacter canadensis]MBZ7996915.1 hypothetical protein [Campylobacter canadensis]MBZ8000394.1 hypothetical protein [Campylobacter canadensis]MBZ8002194.1 hypothetical protein [Campylobacter canadensis]